MSDKQVAFTIGPDTVNLIEELKAPLGALTTADLFRRCLALAEIAVENRAADGTITLLTGRDKEYKIALNK